MRALICTLALLLVGCTQPTPKQAHTQPPFFIELTATIEEHSGDAAIVSGSGEMFILRGDSSPIGSTVRVAGLASYTEEENVFFLDVASSTQVSTMQKVGESATFNSPLGFSLSIPWPLTFSTTSTGADIFLEDARVMSISTIEKSFTHQDPQLFLQQRFGFSAQSLTTATVGEAHGFLLRQSPGSIIYADFPRFILALLWTGATPETASLTERLFYELAASLSVSEKPTHAATAHSLCLLPTAVSTSALTAAEKKRGWYYGDVQATYRHTQ